MIIRRYFLKYLLATVAMFPFTAMFAQRYITNEEELALAFTKEVEENILELFGTLMIEYDERLEVTVPHIAENYAVVPLRIETEIDDIEQVAVFISKSKKPLALLFEDMNLARTHVSARIKVLRTSPIIVLALSGSGRLFGQVKLVKIPSGGCSPHAGVGYES